MRYIDVEWIHDLDDEPYRLVSEIGDDEYETRKLEIFRSGHVGVATVDVNTEKTMLGIVEVPSIEEINSQSEFKGKEITKNEFELLWDEYA
jgi:hypothetical protein